MRKFTVRFAALLLAVFMMVPSVSAAQLLIPVGQVIGLEISENAVTIAGFDSNLGDAARAAGLQEGDRIDKIDGKDIHCAEDVRQALQASDGDVDISIVRGKAVKELELEPAITSFFREDERKAQLYGELVDEVNRYCGEKLSEAILNGKKIR